MPDQNRIPAVTWNVYHGSTVKDLHPLIVEESKTGTVLWFLQEANVPLLADALRGVGLHFAERDQFLIAWDPRRLTPVSRPELVDLSEATWLRAGGGRTNSQGLSLILCDQYGRSLHALDYHLPAHVQPEGTAGREAASRESAITMGDMARDTVATAFLAAGDDNVYEQGPGNFRYLMEGATGLRQIQAAGGTFGKRPIDDFRYPREGALQYVRGSSRTRDGTPAEKPSHRRHHAEFRWARGHAL